MISPFSNCPFREICPKNAKFGYKLLLVDNFIDLKQLLANLPRSRLKFAVLCFIVCSFFSSGHKIINSKNVTPRRRNVSRRRFTTFADNRYSFLVSVKQSRRFFASCAFQRLHDGEFMAAGHRVEFVELLRGHAVIRFCSAFAVSAATRIPADLPAPLSEKLRETALLAFRALGCRHYARVDFFVTGERSFLLNEVNALPGLTDKSMFPRLSAAAGIDFPALVRRLASFATEARA